MNSATIQARIWKAYARAAGIIGESYKFYPSGLIGKLRADDGSLLLADDGSVLEGDLPTPPVASPLSLTSYASLFVSFNAEDMNYKKPNKYGKATWYALFDGTNTQVGDYLVGPAGTYFIAAMQLLLPILAVECNRTVTVFRPQVQTGADGEYAGTTTQNQTPLMTGWPCSILQGTKGEKNESSLPGDTRSPWWSILLPFGGVQILPNDIIVDDQGIRYVVSSPELSDLGYRVTAMTAIS
jgi:hypothetical protein